MDLAINIGVVHREGAGSGALALEEFRDQDGDFFGTRILGELARETFPFAEIGKNVLVNMSEKLFLNQKYHDRIHASSLSVLVPQAKHLAC